MTFQQFTVQAISNETVPKDDSVLYVDSARKYQDIVGFGELVFSFP